MALNKGNAFDNVCQLNLFTPGELWNIDLNQLFIDQYSSLLSENVFIVNVVRAIAIEVDTIGLFTGQGVVMLRRRVNPLCSQ